MDTETRFAGKLAFRLATAAVVIAVLAGPAAALDDGQQILAGGTSGSGAGVRYGAPGLANTYNLDFPDTGLGEVAAQIRMTEGKLSKFRVSVATQGNATSGSVTVTVRLNEADTVLTCTVGTDGGDCGSGAKSVNVVNGDRLAVEVDSTLDQGFFAYSYTMLYD